MAGPTDTPRARGDHDAPHISPVTPAEDERTIHINNISWAAVFAGSLIGIVAQLALNLLGLGVGLGAADPVGAGGASADTLSVGAGVWTVIAGVLGAFIGGAVAGRLSGRPKESTAAWHGLTAWALTTVATIYLLSSALGSLVGGVFSTAGSAVGGIAHTAGAAAQTAADKSDDPTAAIKRQITGALGGTDPTMAREAAGSAMGAVLSGDPQEQAEARERAATALAQSRNIPIDQARIEVSRLEAQYRAKIERTKASALKTAQAAERTGARASIIGAIMLLLGALAAWFGGRFGAVDPTMTGYMPVRRP